MLHIILTLLKIIGIILAILICLLITALVLILLVPVRYQLSGECHEKKLSGEVLIRWLLRILSVRIAYVQDEFSYDVRVFGYRLITSDEAITQKRLLRKAKRKIKKGVRDVEEEVLQATSIDDDVSEIAAEPKEDKPNEPSTGKPQIGEQNEEDEKRGFLGWIKDVIEKIKNFFHKIKAAFLRIIEIKNKIEVIKEFVQSERVRQAYHSVKRYLIKLIRHIKPRVLRGKLVYGFEDPALTGKTLGILGVCMPIYEDHMDITPVFDDVAFEVELYARGRIRMGYLIYVGILALRDKNLIQVIKEIQANLGGN